VPLQKGWVFDSPQPQMYLVSPPIVTGYGPLRDLFTILAMVPPFKLRCRQRFEPPVLQFGELYASAPPE
jgi:hypothetical protein